VKGPRALPAVAKGHGGRLVAEGICKTKKAVSLARCLVVLSSQRESRARGIGRR